MPRPVFPRNRPTPAPHRRVPAKKGCWSNGLPGAHNPSVSEPYGVRVTDDAVVAWSVRRLPFEPKGWLKDYRDELRVALRSLSWAAGTHLRAAYASPDREF